MIPQEPERHDKAADAVHEGRPVDAELVRSGRKGPRILVLLVVSTLAAAVLQWVEAKSSAPAKIAAVEQRFTALHAELQRDTSKLATDAIQQILAS